MNDNVVNLEVAPAPDLGGDPGTSKPDHSIPVEGTDREIVRVFGQDGSEALNENFGRAIWVEVDQ